MRKLFLHIGTHKTGTTFFQAFLLDNRERLRRAGVAICTERHKDLGLIANCISLPDTVLRPSLMTVARMTGHAKGPSLVRFAKSVAHVAKFLSDGGATHFILSAEAFCFAREPKELRKIRKLFGASDVEVVPVVCFRNDKAWRESWRSEIDRWASRLRRPHGEGNGNIRGDWYLDKDAILQFWQQIGDVRTIDFDAAVDRHGTIMPSLLEAMEIGETSRAKEYFLNARD